MYKQWSVRRQADVANHAAAPGRATLGTTGQADAFSRSRGFPDLRYVHIVRDDELRQAISMLLAMRTDYWQRIVAAPATRSGSAWAEAALRVDASMPRSRIRTDGADTRWSAEQIAQDLEDAARRAQLIFEIDRCRA